MGLTRLFFRSVPTLLVLSIAGPLFSGYVLGQPMYRCTVNHSTVFQDQPCSASDVQTPIATQLAAPSNAVRVRPIESLSDEHKKDLETLSTQYFETFWLMGRAQSCGWKNAKRYKELVKQLEDRHPSDLKAVGNVALVGMSSGLKNSVPLKLDTLIALANQPCMVIIGKAQAAQLPDVPASLVLSNHSIADHTLYEGKAKTGVYRILEEKAKHDDEPSKYFVSHHDKKVFISKDRMEYVALIENGSTPLLLIAAKDSIGQCPNRNSYVSFHTMSLPQVGEPAVTRLKVDCAKIETFKVGSSSHLCFKYEEVDAKPAQLYKIDLEGKVVLEGIRQTKGCPSSDVQGGQQTKKVVDL